MSEQTIILSDNISSYQVGYAPLTLTLNPSGFSTVGGPVIKIEYDFDDSSKSITVNRLLNTTNLSGTAYPNDLGDPRNVSVVHTLIPSTSSDPQLYNIKVKVTRGNTFTPTLYTLPLYVYKVNALDGAAQGYFEDIHIINSRVFGADNNKIYTFETVNPRYITFLSHSNRTIADIGNVKILHITYQTTSNNAGYRLLPLDNIITDNDILGDYVIDFRLKNNGNTTLTVSSVSCDNVLQFQPITFTPTVLQPGEYTTVSLSAIPPVAGSTDTELNGLVYVKSDLETRSIDVSITYKPILEYISWPAGESIETFDDYAVGSLSTLYGGLGWGAAGTLLDLSFNSGTETFEDYDTGAASSLSAGSGFAAAGTLLDLSFNSGTETFEDYDTGNVSTLAGGSGFAGPATLTLYTDS